VDEPVTLPFGWTRLLKEPLYLMGFHISHRKTIDFEGVRESTNGKV